VLFVGDNVACNVIAPMTHGMRAALVRPHGLRPGEELADGALLIGHIRDLSAFLWTRSPPSGPITRRCPVLVSVVTPRISA
jgi:hypothetical protein